MANKSLLHTFPIDGYVKGAYHSEEILFKYNGLVAMTVYWSETYFIMSLKQNIVFVKLIELSFGIDIIASFTEFQCQGTDAFGSVWV